MTNGSVNHYDDRKDKAKLRKVALDIADRTSFSLLEWIGKRLGIYEADKSSHSIQDYKSKLKKALNSK